MSYLPKVKLTCDYCDQDFGEGEICQHCNGNPPAMKQFIDQGWMFYDKYVVYGQRCLLSDRLKFRFYLGRSHEGDVIIGRRELEEIVPEYCDYMPFVFEKFKEQLETDHAR